MSQKLPKHVAIIMDGNGRWAENQGLPRIEGHRAGLDNVKLAVKCCLKYDIKMLSLFAFSSENWSRPETEVDFLMSLFSQALDQGLSELQDQRVCLRIIGDRNLLSEELCTKMEFAENSTSKNHALQVNLILNYSGKWDILQAVKHLVHQAITHEIDVTQIDEDYFSRCLSTRGLPDPDLLIRTSGEQRISNFFLWQLAYTELYFTEMHWPDFSEQIFTEALSWFNQRERRFGLTSKQLSENKHV